MALGQESFGLYGLIGSLVLFVGFIGGEFSASLSRFYAYAIGKSCNDRQQGLEECRAWFSAGVLIHVVLPVVLVLVGYPIGAYAIRNGCLTIPAERVSDCILLWRFVMISTYVGVLAIPFNAMFIAKQEIAELTLYSLVQTCVKTMFIYYMTTVDRDWLVPFGGFLCLFACLPSFVVVVRSMFAFKECRLRTAYLVQFSRIAQISKFALWRMANGLSRLARHQYQEIIINRHFGPKVNASYTIGATLAAESAVLTAGLTGAFLPAITSACGAGDVKTMREMAFRASKFGVMLTLLLATPLLIESEEVLLLWLKDPPPYAQGIFCWIVASVIIEEFSIGHYAAINAVGNIGRFYLVRSLVGIIALIVPVALLLLRESPYMVALGIVVTSCFILAVDLYYGKGIAGLSFSRLFRRVLLPIVCSAALAASAGAIVVVLFNPSFARIIATSVVVDLIQGALFWFMVLDGDERGYVLSRMRNLTTRLFRRRPDNG